jgi:predicted ferric reductase
MAFGLLISGRISRTWPGGLEAFELHRFCSLLALGFTLIHFLVLFGDPRLGGSLAPLFTPGMLSAKAPWAWLGQLAFYALLLVVSSFYVRRWIGKQAWRLVHTATFALYLAALAHSVGATSDSSIPVISAMYWSTGGGLLLLVAARLVAALRAKSKGKRKRQRAASPAGT